VAQAAPVVVFVVLALALLAWAKWQPYSAKVPKVAATHDLGTSILTGAAGAPPAVSLASGLTFVTTYFRTIWPTLVAGLVLAAAVQVLLPEGWLQRVLGRPGMASGVRGGLLSVPTLMCTCTAAPVTVGLRRKRVSVGAGLAFWIGNPALNPVVLAFCLLVLPWPWAVLRAAAGILLVAAVIGIISRLGSATDELAAAPIPLEPEPVDRRPLLIRFLAALGGLTVRLLPGFVLLVFVLGALRGVLLPLGGGPVTGVLAVVGFAVAGTLLLVPGGGEIAAVAALLAVGVSAPVAAALLITLPAISLPSLFMVRRVFPRSALLATVASVITLGLLCAAAAAVLGL
jgi:uncharacterized membrane protein YraQ (UPF0718 family)